MALQIETVNRTRAQMPGNNYITFFSRKNLSNITAESELEYAAFLSFECDPTITTYIPHPGKHSVEYPDGNVVGTIFDAYVEWSDGNKALYEVKYFSDLMKPHAVKQRETQKLICAMYDIDYRILTDTELFGPKAYYSNLKYITTQYFNLVEGVAEHQAKTVLDVIDTLGGSCRIGEIVDYGLDPEEVMSSICYLIMYGYIHPDIREHYINYSMEVSYED